MGLMDKVKASAEVGLAKATDVGHAGLATLDAAQAKHRADGLLRELGLAAHANHVGRGTDASAEDAARIVSQLEAHEAQYGTLS
jgi:hypothetical protein